MNATLRLESRTLVETLAVSHTVVQQVHLLRLEVRGPGTTGVGEVTVGPWDTCPAATVSSAIEELIVGVERSWPGDVHQVRQLLAPAYAMAPPAATLVVEMALLDALSRAAAIPLWRYLGLPRPQDHPLFTTVDLQATAFPWADNPGRYKVKLGSTADAAVLASCARMNGSQFLFDVNCGWDRATYRAHEQALASCRPLGVEDPVRDLAELEPVRGSWRRQRIFLDEPVRSVSQVRTYAASVAGINIKLLKFGGLLPALDATRVARQAGAQVMLGCFVEPARSIAYATALTGLADLVDLDGERWLTGIVRTRGLLGPGPGIGVPG